MSSIEEANREAPGCANSPADGHGYTLTLSCPDKPGIVFAVSGFLAERGYNIVESQQFGDRSAGTFFMRVQFRAECSAEDLTSRLNSDFAETATAYAMEWRLVSVERKQRILIMVSKVGHCLNDLLYRSRNGGLDVEVCAVVSNHPDLGTMARNWGVPFFHIPVSPESREDAETRLIGLVNDLDVDLVVLARYMQILSADLCDRLTGRAINIHHSMLPSFKGARPYFQAHDRGVKLVGATAHYVTSHLDEGPIIEQEIARVTHAMTARQVTELGRDNESRALCRAVRWHTENRVLMNGSRTVVFN